MGRITSRDEAAKHIADRMDERDVIDLDYQPGNGSAYTLVFANTTNGWVLAIPNFKVAWGCQLGAIQSTGYVAEKWFDNNVVDGAEIAALLNAVVAIRNPQYVRPELVTAELLRLGWTDDETCLELDTLVHDAKGGEAADINNGGVDAQIEFLGEKAVIDYLRSQS